MFRKKITSFVTILAATMWLAGAGCDDSSTDKTVNTPSVTEAPRYHDGNYKNRIAEDKIDSIDSEVLPEEPSPLDDPYDGAL